LFALRQACGYGDNPNVEMRLIANAAYFIQLEQPEALGEQIGQFVAGRGEHD
jgi:hypothetical protein